VERILVAYASKHGSTAEIAEAIAATLRERDCEVDCVEADEVEDLAGYDGVVVGSAVYMKRWLGPAMHFLRRHRVALTRVPFWIFSSGPTGDPAGDDPGWSEPHGMLTKAQRLGARGHVVFGGRLAEEGFMHRSMRERTPPEFRDRRDWDAIGAWAERIADELEAAGRRATH
jgi:menaquinone-dependent protoporphyrinogen oxidase